MESGEIVETVERIYATSERRKERPLHKPGHENRIQNNGKDPADKRRYVDLDRDQLGCHRARLPGLDRGQLLNLPETVDHATHGAGDKNQRCPWNQAVLGEKGGRRHGKDD